MLNYQHILQSFELKHDKMNVIIMYFQVNILGLYRGARLMNEDDNGHVAVDSEPTPSSNKTGLNFEPLYSWCQVMSNPNAEMLDILMAYK